MGQMPTTAVQIWIQMVHRFVAVVIAAAVSGLFRQSAGTAAARLDLWSTLWLVMILVQIGLGAWTIWSNKAADVATAHMALGSPLAVLAGGAHFPSLRGQTQDFVLPDARNPRLMERVV